MTAYTVEVLPDEDAESPREWDNVGRFAGLTPWLFNDDAGDYRAVRSDAGEPILAIPIYVLDGPYTIVRPTTWDHADGFYYAPLSKIAAERFDGPQALRACLLGEVDTLNQYLAGDVYGYVVTDSGGEVVDSCWGFYGEDDARTEGQEAADYEAFKAAAAWSALPEWVRRTVLIQVDEDESPRHPGPVDPDLNEHLSRLAF